MEHLYLMAEGNLRILTPGIDSMTQVKNELIEQTPEKLVRRSTYPNGFQITFEQYSGLIFLHCNQPLTENGDGSFTAPTDK